MPFRRAYAGRRRRFRRPLFRRRRRMGRNRRMGSFPQAGLRVHRFRVMTNTIGPTAVTSLSQVNGTETIQNLAFRLNDLPNAAEFTALYDMFRINAVKIRFIPNYTLAAFSATGPTVTGNRIFAAVDYDGGSPASVAALREYGTCRELSFWRPSSIYIKYPRVQGICEQSVGVNVAGFSVGGKRMWFDAATPAINFYGLIVAITAGAAAAPALQSWAIEATYYMSFRNNR